MTTSGQSRVVISGASGFIGMELLRRLSSTHQVIALTRSQFASTELPTHQEAGIYWLQCNLFSLKQTETAMEGAQAAYFLVHSMSPAARLTQGQYDDLDLLIADNFSRAAKTAGVNRIIYLGGIQPGSGKTSAHLRSRLEVEHVLKSRMYNLVALRAGLILGAGGSSSLILVKLIQRLPILICPSWTRKLSSPLALSDTADALVAALQDEQVPAGVYDLAGPEIISYRDLMQRSASELNVRRFFIPFIGVPPQLSRLWVSLITGAPKELVSPLIQSLLVDMLPGKTAPEFTHTRAKVRLTSALHQAELPPIKLVIAAQASSQVETTQNNDSVVSIQRLMLPTGWSAIDIAFEYARWLPTFLKPFLRLEYSENNSLLSFYLRGWGQPLLILSYVAERSDAERALFFVRGGLLRKKNSNPASRLEFRIVKEQGIVLSAVLDFHPALPWPIYLLTQAQAHKLVMWQFAKRLKKIKLNASRQK